MTTEELLLFKRGGKGDMLLYQELIDERNNLEKRIGKANNKIQDTDDCLDVFDIHNNADIEHQLSILNSNLTTQNQAYVTKIEKCIADKKKFERQKLLLTIRLNAVKNQITNMQKVKGVD